MFFQLEPLGSQRLQIIPLPHFTMSKKKGPYKPVACYDFRHNLINDETGEEIPRNDIIKSFKGITKKWALQIEEGDSGYKHYQGRVSLIKKRRKMDALKLFSIPFMYFEPTETGEYIKGNAFYQLKVDTRIAGPWTDKDINNDDLQEELYVPRQYRNIMDNLRPFQEDIIKSADEFNARTINLIVCVEGNKGKSVIASLCELFKNGIDLPPCNDAEKLIASLCNICVKRNLRNPSPVFIDLPRAMEKSRLHGVITAIEQIKKGKLYDLRYQYKTWWIDSPAIWVFSNHLPDLDLLSRDRWKLWMINDDYELVEYKLESDLPDTIEIPLNKSK